ncbi:MAG: hypothetical protein J1E39_10150 [Eubacterium sp.]|nr:hypothetical protein [Eubacterium sp.]
MTKSRFVTAIVSLCVAAAVALILCAVYFLISNGSLTQGTFYFSSGTAGKFDDSLPSLSAEEVRNYTPRHADCISDFYKQQLDDNELCIYNAALYAADNEYTCIYFPYEIYDEDRPINDTLSCLSCDSPFFEHNFTSDGEFGLSSITFSGGEQLYFFELPHNAAEYAEKREQAYNKAKEIVDGMPSYYSTDFDKAAYLYDYVVENTLYDYSDRYNSDTVPIYDALVDEKHTTVCDGYSDTVSLLYNLAGLPTFTVEGENDRGIGHVVNLTLLDGEYYYLDSTSDFTAWEMGIKGRFYYLMTDSLLGSYFKIDELFSQYDLPKTGAYPAEHAANIAITEITDEAVADAVQILKAQGSVAAAFSASLDRDRQNDFGRMIASEVKTDITVTRMNAIVAFSYKKAA